jgi:hypothetical protein
MTRRPWAAIVLCASIGCGPPQAANPVGTGGPHRFTDPGGAVSITFPAVPKALVPGPRANPDRVVVWQAVEGGMTFTLWVTRLAEEVADEVARADDGAGDSYWQETGRRSVTVDGQPGERVEYASVNGEWTSISVSARSNGTDVLLSVNLPTGEMSGREVAEAFIASCQFTR